MAIKIVLSSYTIEVDSEDELRTALRALETHQIPMPMGSAQPPQNNGHLDDPYRKFLGSLRSPRSTAMVKALANAKHGLTDAQLRETLSLGNNLELAGVMRGVDYAARKAGLTLPKIWKRTRDGKVLTYKLRTAVSQAVRNAEASQGLR